MAEGRPTPDQEALSKIDTTVPHSARIWNYWMGGKDNYEVDRIAGDAYREIAPNIETMAKASRVYLISTVTFVARECGIRQFLDIGTGLPTYDNTHQVAQKAAPESRIVYVDNDPLVLRHAQALLTSTPEGVTDYVDADLHNPDAILEAAGKILDFSKPVALMLMGILGHIQDYEEAKSIVSRLQAELPPGSYSPETVTEALRQAMVHVKRAAVQNRNNYIGTEHLLWGLTVEDNSATRLLRAAGVPPETVHQSVATRLSMGASQAAERIAWTPYSRKAIAIAEARSEAAGSELIDCDDLLVGLAQVGRGVAATVLTDAGFDPAALDVASDMSEDDRQPENA